MITLKSEREIGIMKEAGRIAANALKEAGKIIKPGITTAQIDAVAYEYIKSMGATPSFLGYGGFPATCCISVNEVVIHGIPSKKCVIKEGDIVSIDMGAKYKGYHGDTTKTFACGEISEEAKKLLQTTQECLNVGIKQAVVGARIGDIANAIQKYAEERSYSVVRDFVGHGVGAHLHEDPSVPNYGKPHSGIRLLEGMTIAIEPMINVGSFEVEVLDDDWTVVTADSKLSAHFEHTIAVTKNEPVILTQPD